LLVPSLPLCLPTYCCARLHGDKKDLGATTTASHPPQAPTTEIKSYPVHTLLLKASLPTTIPNHSTFGFPRLGSLSSEVLAHSNRLKRMCWAEVTPDWTVAQQIDCHPCPGKSAIWQQSRHVHDIGTAREFSYSDFPGTSGVSLETQLVRIQGGFCLCKTRPRPWHIDQLLPFGCDSSNFTLTAIPSCDPHTTGTEIHIMPPELN